MSFNGQISGSLAPQGTKVGNLSGSIGAVVPDIRDESVTTAKLADEAPSGRLSVLRSSHS